MKQNNNLKIERNMWLTYLGQSFQGIQMGKEQAFQQMALESQNIYMQNNESLLLPT